MERGRVKKMAEVVNVCTPMPIVCERVCVCECRLFYYSYFPPTILFVFDDDDDGDIDDVDNVLFAFLYKCERVQVFRLFSFAVHALFLIINESNGQSIVL